MGGGGGGGLINTRLGHRNTNNEKDREHSTHNKNVGVDVTLKCCATSG